MPWCSRWMAVAAPLQPPLRRHRSGLPDFARLWRSGLHWCVRARVAPSLPVGVFSLLVQKGSAALFLAAELLGFAACCCWLLQGLGSLNAGQR